MCYRIQCVECGKAAEGAENADLLGELMVDVLPEQDAHAGLL